MNEQNQFMQKIEDLVELAKRNHREVTKEFLDQYFEKMSLRTEQLQMVYDYLISNHIKVKGYHAKKTESSQQEIPVKEEEESEFLSVYLNELKEQPKQQELSAELVERMLQKDERAKEQVVHYFLPYVVQMTKEYCHQGLSQSDLIQEGNVGLLLGLQNVQWPLEMSLYIEEVLAQVRHSILNALDECRADQRRNQKIIQKADDLKEKVEELSEELDDKISVEDIANYMDLDLDEIEDILRVTGEEV